MSAASPSDPVMGGEAPCIAPWKLSPPVSHEQARESARAFINHYFHNDTPRTPRVGIPARPGYDDDLLLHAYVYQRQEAERQSAKALTRAQLQASVLLGALKPFAVLVEQIERDHGPDWAAPEQSVMRASLAYPAATDPVRWQAFLNAREAIASIEKEPGE